jgi:hypothetical protein
LGPAGMGRDDDRIRWMLLFGLVSGHTGLVLRFRSSPDTATRSCELRKQRSSSNSMILVRALNLKFLNDLAATAAGTSNSPH